MVAYTLYFFYIDSVCMSMWIMDACVAGLWSAGTPRCDSKHTCHVGWFKVFVRLTPAPGFFFSKSLLSHIPTHFVCGWG